MPSELLTERQGAVLILTISDPETRNTLSEAVITAGIEALSTAEADNEIRAIVLRGAGSHFCAGGNLQGLLARRQAGPPVQARMLELLHQWIEALRACPKPVIAAVEGAAAGAGCSLALACDLLVASREAKFTLAYGRIGFSPDGGASWQLAGGMTRQQALEWLWLAQTRSGEELQRSGLVSRLSAPGEALATALALADELAQMAPNALASVKALVGAPAATLAEQLERERDAFVANVNHANGAEGLAAWHEKRRAQFR